MGAHMARELWRERSGVREWGSHSVPSLCTTKPPNITVPGLGCWAGWCLLAPPPALRAFRGVSSPQGLISGCCIIFLVTISKEASMVFNFHLLGALQEWLGLTKQGSQNITRSLHCEWKLEWVPGLEKSLQVCWMQSMHALSGAGLASIPS